MNLQEVSTKIREVNQALTKDASLREEHINTLITCHHQVTKLSKAYLSNPLLQEAHKRYTNTLHTIVNDYAVGDQLPKNVIKQLINVTKILATAQVAQGSN